MQLHEAGEKCHANKATKKLEKCAKKSKMEGEGQAAGAGECSEKLETSGQPFCAQGAAFSLPSTKCTVQNFVLKRAFQ